MINLLKSFNNNEPKVKSFNGNTKKSLIGIETNSETFKTTYALKVENLNNKDQFEYYRCSIEDSTLILDFLKFETINFPEHMSNFTNEEGELIYSIQGLNLNMDNYYIMQQSHDGSLLGIHENAILDKLRTFLSRV
jgi:hypothetical protein